MRVAMLLSVFGTATACVGPGMFGADDDDAFDGLEGSGAHTGPIEVAVVPKAVGLEFSHDIRSGAVCAAEAFDDVAVRWEGVAAGSDIREQVDLLQDIIDDGVDAVAYAAANAELLADVTAQARAAGITVVNLDSGTDPQPDDVAIFGTDDLQSTQRAAEELGDALGEGEHEVALIPPESAGEPTDRQIAGFRRGLDELPHLTEVAQRSADSDAATLVGWDAAEEHLAALRDGTIDALVVRNPFRMGYEAVEAAVIELREGTAPQSGDTGVMVVTRDNLDSAEVEAILNPSCDDPPTG